MRADKQHLPERSARQRAALYVLMRRNSKVVSGLMTSPFISRSG
jgi:hypothetical protein